MPKTLKLKTKQQKWPIQVVVHTDGTVCLFEDNGFSRSVYLTPEEWEKVSVFVLEQYKKLNSTT